MTTLTFGDPIPGQANASEEPKIPTALDAIKNWANGNIDQVNLSPAFLKTVMRGVTAANGASWNFSFGSGSFVGDNTYQHQVVVPHKLPAGSKPQHIIMLPSLAIINGSSVGWAAAYGQYAAADATNFYVVWQQYAFATTTGGAVVEYGFLSGDTYFYNFMAIG